jgi:hypothetical protein
MSLGAGSDSARLSLWNKMIELAIYYVGDIRASEPESSRRTCGKFPSKQSPLFLLLEARNSNWSISDTSFELLNFYIVTAFSY